MPPVSISEIRRSILELFLTMPIYAGLEKAVASYPRNLSIKEYNFTPVVHMTFYLNQEIPTQNTPCLRQNN